MLAAKKSKGIQAEFEHSFYARGQIIRRNYEEDFKSYLKNHVYHCYIPKLEISWKDRASWRFIFLWSKLWKQLPQEIYEMIDQRLVKSVYTCSVCKTKKDYPFECKGE